MNQSVEVILRTISAYAWLLLYTKLIGKRLVAQSSNHLFVLSILLGTVGGNMAFNIKIGWIEFLLSLLVISGIGYALVEASLRSKKASAVISGEPIVIMKGGMLLEEQMKACNYSLDALKQGLRSKDIFALEEVEQAVLEVDGTLSVQKKSDYRTITLKDLKTYFPGERFPE